MAFYVCGPEGLKDRVVSTLAANKIPSQRVFVEEFAASAREPAGEQYPVEILLADGQRRTIRVAQNQTVLEVARAERVSIPHACGSGTCGSCKMKVTSGHVVPIPESIPALVPQEQAKGYTLACQCYPKSALRLQEGFA